MMQVSEIMKRLVHTVRAAATVEHASRLMRDEEIGFLPVVEQAMVQETYLRRDVVEEIGFQPVVDEDVLVGVLTDRDLVVRGIASEKDPKTTPVSEIMTRNFSCCYEDDDISEAAAIMERKKVRRLFALNHEQHIVGVLSIDDISAVDTCISGEVLHAVTE